MKIINRRMSTSGKVEFLQVSYNGIILPLNRFTDSSKLAIPKKQDKAGKYTDFQVYDFESKTKELEFWIEAETMLTGILVSEIKTAEKKLDKKETK